MALYTIADTHLSLNSKMSDIMATVRGKLVLAGLFLKLKSAMKAYYAKAGIKTARYHLVEDFDGAAAFANYVGYPVVVKPDNGVGAAATYKLKSDEDLVNFMETKPEGVPYIMEEFVNAEVNSYDAIIDSNGEPIFETGNVTPNSVMDIVNNNDNSIYYIVKDLPEDTSLQRKIKAMYLSGKYIYEYAGACFEED